MDNLRETNGTLLEQHYLLTDQLEFMPRRKKALAE